MQSCTRRAVLIAMGLAVTSVPALAQEAPRAWDFEGTPAGQAPAGFTFARSAGGKEGQWVVQAAADAPSGKQVLVQLDADNSADRFLMAVAAEPAWRDGQVAVRCKPLSGQTDQACGLVFRYQDARNYYVTRANVLEDNVRLYFVKDGRRQQIASWSGKVAGNVWHELRAEARGDVLKVFWDGKPVLEAKDSAFSAAGKVGVWTKADAVTAFDDFTVTSLDARTRPLAAGGSRGEGLRTQEIEQLTGAKGVLNAAEGVFKVSVPRTDLKVTAAGVKIVPRLGLTSWAAFTRGGDTAMVMGDLVLQEDQVSPVMDAALAQGLEVTALHNHFLWDSPRVMFMHIGGMGEERQLASAVGKVFSRIKETSGGKGITPRASIDPARSTLDAARLDTTLGTQGELKDGVYRAVFGRTVKMHGIEVGNAMGVNTWAAFAGSDTQAVVDGDFAMLESELQPVLKSLRAAGIHVVAIHNHMTGEVPRMMFLHYWGVGPAEVLARGIRGALEQTGTPR